MPLIAIAAALGASATWALCALLSHWPAKALGSFEFGRVQFVSATLVLFVIVSLTGGWSSIDWSFWLTFLISGACVIGANLATVGALRRGGPRREQLMRALSPPIAAVLGFLFLGETLSGWVLLGGAMVLAGIVLAIMFGKPGAKVSSFEKLEGPLSTVIVLGVVSALCHAGGIVVLKPALVGGIDPFAASLLRTGGAAAIAVTFSLWPSRYTRPPGAITGRHVLAAMLPGLLGYIVAVSLLLFALKSHEAGVVLVLASSAPVLLLPMLWVKTGQRPPIQAWLGAVLAVAGAGVILIS